MWPSIGEFCATAANPGWPRTRFKAALVHVSHLPALGGFLSSLRSHGPHVLLTPSGGPWQAQGSESPSMTLHSFLFSSSTCWSDLLHSPQEHWDGLRHAFDKGERMCLVPVHGVLATFVAPASADALQTLGGHREGPSPRGRQTAPGIVQWCTVTSLFHLCFWLGDLGQRQADEGLGCTVSDCVTSLMSVSSNSSQTGCGLISSRPVFGH